MPNVTNNFFHRRISIKTILHILPYTSAQLSSDASRLVVYSTSSSFEIGLSSGEVRVYSTNQSLEIGNLEYSAQLSDSHYGCNATFTNSGDVLVEAREANGTVLYRLEPGSSRLERLDGTGGDPQLYVNGKVYMGIKDRDAIYVLDERFNPTPVFSLKGRTLSGSLTQRVYKLVPEVVEQPYTVYSRVVGNKEYELKDHLGNVRALVSDVKTLATPAAAKTEPVYQTGLLAYYSYYPSSAKFLTSS